MRKEIKGDVLQMELKVVTEKRQGKRVAHCCYDEGGGEQSGYRMVRIIA